MRKTTTATFVLTTLTLVPVSSWGFDTSSYKSPEEIPYRFVTADGPSVRRRDGATVYKNKPRGYIDGEPMLEVVYADRPAQPMRVDVIPYAPYADIERGVVRDTRRKVMYGEDKIFATINRDVIKARCMLLGKDCDKTPEYKAKQDSLYPPIETKPQELQARTKRSKARRRELLEYPVYKKR
ncbi:MAG: hypothetical protein OIF57_08135 [Marinobacterium sp.]|nr:hypothetical protein [Marinobacterium sp.]